MHTPKGRTTKPGPTCEPDCIPLHALLGRFESIGDNCEFGLVQRYCGVENLGLLRFSASRIDDLIHALDSDFELYGQGNDLFVYPHASNYLFCRSHRYVFEYNTGHLAGSDDPAAVLKRESRKVAYLKRRFLEDLRLGEKILLRKAGADEGSDAVAALLRAVRRHGSCELLSVRAGRADRACAVTRAAGSRGGSNGSRPTIRSPRSISRPGSTCAAEPPPSSTAFRWLTGLRATGRPSICCPPSAAAQDGTGRIRTRSRPCSGPWSICSRSTVRRSTP
ncbi:hypothetical protein ACFQWF_16330 [Methylorubrum suomiense]